MRFLRLPSSWELQQKEDQVFLAATILLGVFGALAAVSFTLAIEWVRHLLLGPEPSAWRLVLAPTLVSLVTGLLLARYLADARGSGVPQTTAAYRLHGGRIPGRVVVGKFLTAALTVGAGHSMGREGPSVQIGGGIASVIGRWLRLPPERARSLVPIGAAAALSAAFNTPVAAVLFALEEIIGDLNAALIGSTVVASVVAVVVERAILGNETLFRVPAYHLVHPAELAGYALLGLVGGLVSVAFCRLLLRARTAFRRMPGWTVAIQPALGGLAVGLMLLVVPQVMGVGYEHVDQALQGGLALKAMILLAGAKLVATIVSYASGNAGGIFAPSLFLGAMVGGAVGNLMNAWAPFPTGEAGAYALVGMGTLFAGIIRAPMTSVFMIFELTQDYEIMVPLMVANLLSYAISRRLQPVAIYHALLAQDGVHLPSAAERSEGGGWRAADVMVAPEPFLPGEIPVVEARRRLDEAGCDEALVGTRERLLGVVSRGALGDGAWDAEPLASRIAANAGHVHPDHPLDLVVERFRRGPGFLPVLSRGGEALVVGVVTRGSLQRLLEPEPSARR